MLFVMKDITFASKKKLLILFPSIMNIEQTKTFLKNMDVLYG
jgi:hypothetical protein